MRDAFRSMTLKTRIVVLVMVLVMAGIWGVALHATTTLQDDVEQLLAAQLSMAAASIAADLDHDLDLRVRAMDHIARGVTPAMLGSREALQAYLQGRRMANVPFDMDLVVTDRQGFVLAEHPVKGRVGRQTHEAGYFSDGAGGARAYHVRAALLDPDGSATAVSLVLPLRDAAGRFAGTIVETLSLSDPGVFTPIDASHSGSKGYFEVMARDERLVLAATGALTGAALPPRGVVPLLDHRLDEGYEGPGLNQGVDGNPVLSVSGNMKNANWSVVGMVPVDEIFAPARSLRNEIYIAALILSLLLGVSVRFALGRELGRLNELGRVMKRMSSGEQPFAEISVTREDEIGKLKINFNHLIAERNRLDEALRAEIDIRTDAQEALKHAMSRLQSLSEHLTRAHEEERREIAAELHEELAQELSALQLQLQLVETRCGGEAMQALHEARATLSSVLERVRSIAVDLRPVQLDDFGLYVTLRGYCRQQAAQAGWTLHFDSQEARRRPHRDVEIACFRIVEQALTNVAHHASATEVWVTLRERGNALEVSVRDDGVGFDVKRELPEDSVGLLEFIERARQVGGHATVYSATGRGTEIRATFPLAA